MLYLCEGEELYAREYIVYTLYSCEFLVNIRLK